jgi:hypothetical protein
MIAWKKPENIKICLRCFLNFHNGEPMWGIRWECLFIAAPLSNSKNMGIRSDLNSQAFGSQAFQ